VLSASGSVALDGSRIMASSPRPAITLSRVEGLFPTSADFQLRGNQGYWRRVQAVATPDAALFCPEVVVNCRRGKFVMRFN
jgi:hypothetical protein